MTRKIISCMSLLVMISITYVPTETGAMKVRASVKKVSPNDKIVKKRGRVYVIKEDNRKHKQRQG